jgi:hypothetical protein
VQDAFYATNRVMCVSLHKFGDNFFPGTGGLEELGIRAGKYYSLNVPLKDGIDDDGYLSVFKPVIQGVMDWYRPSGMSPCCVRCRSSLPSQLSCCSAAQIRCIVTVWGASISPSVATPSVLGTRLHWFSSPVPQSPWTGS